MSDKEVTLTYNGRTITLPVITGSEGEKGVDIHGLRDATGLVAYDPGFGNTGSCQSAITFVDGEKGILRYRGYPIEELAAKSTFVETALLLITGELPDLDTLTSFRTVLREQELLHEDLLHHFETLPPGGDPMSILAAVINSFSSYHPELVKNPTEATFMQAVAKIMSKVRTIAAFCYCKSRGLPFVYPDPSRNYVENLLHMMFSIPHKPFKPPLGATRALSLFLILNADHEQNCSTSAVRMVGSTRANMFTSLTAGISALWGELHGGASASVVRMLQDIHDGRCSVQDYLADAKSGGRRLMGFGHRVYKEYDPRAAILRQAAHKLIFNIGDIKDDLLPIAQEIEDLALADEYFMERKLYPNVDFYAGIILRALNIPIQMFPVMLAMAAMPGWLANWYESTLDSTRLHRPRQIYIGKTERCYVPLEERPLPNS